MKQDPYFTHAFGAVYDEMTRRGQGQRRVLLPMLVRTISGDWNYARIPDLEVSSRVGTIWACIGSQESIAVMESDPAVLSIEASRPASTFDVQQSIKHVKADKIHNTACN
jgi:hypothetical protein